MPVLLAVPEGAEAPFSVAAPADMMLGVLEERKKWKDGRFTACALFRSLASRNQSLALTKSALYHRFVL